MSLVLRIGLIVVSILTLIFITRKVRNAQVRLEDSIFWFCVAGLLLILSIFPQIFYVISDFAGIISPANLVFLLFIFILLILGFNLSGCIDAIFSQAIRSTSCLRQEPLSKTPRSISVFIFLRLIRSSRSSRNSSRSRNSSAIATTVNCRLPKMKLSKRTCRQMSPS